MAIGRRLMIAHQSAVVWLFTNDKADIGSELEAFVEEGMLGDGDGDSMPYNPQVLEAIVEAGLWER